MIISEFNDETGDRKAGICVRQVGLRYPVPADNPAGVDQALCCSLKDSACAFLLGENYAWWTSCICSGKGKVSTWTLEKAYPYN